jgi:hypothetical protein
MSTITLPAKTVTSTVTSTATETPQTVTITSEITVTTSIITTQTTTSATTNTEQSQEIVSTDGKLKILNHKLSKQMLATQFVKWIQGDVQNISDSAVVCIISVDFINTDGSIAETQEVSFRLDPNATKKYSVYSGGAAGEISYIGWDSDEYVISVKTGS